MGDVSLAPEYDVAKPNWTTRARPCWQLIKPGIVFGNLIPVVSGFLLAGAQWQDAYRLVQVLLATFCLIASACLLNNYFDRDLDGRMSRTKHRLLASQIIPAWPVFLAAGVFLLLSIFLLAAFNTTTLLVGGFGYLMYVWVYTVLLKRYSSYQTILGSFAGACPPVIGYCSLSGQIDLTAGLIFLLFAFWQIPHSYAIAIFRRNDYRMADVPVLPIVRGVRYTQQVMMLYWLLYIFAGVLLFATGVTGWLFLGLFGYFGLRWGAIGCRGLSTKDLDAWARQFFVYSIKVMVAVSFAIVIDQLMR